MSAETLREAAKVLRERAEAATPGPWMVDGSQVYPTAHGAPLVAATRTHSLSDTPDAAYIAMMHPGVALALADWLDLAADDHDAGCPSDCPATRVVDAILEGER